MRKSDACYVNAFKNRDENLQQEFYRECWQYYSKCYRNFITQEQYKDDVFQDAFLDFWQMIDYGTIIAKNGSVFYCRNNEYESLSSSLMTFIMSMCRNRYNQYLRRYELEMSLEELIEARNHSSNNDGSGFHPVISIPDSKEIKTIIIDRCIEQLPERCRDILTKFYYLNMSLDQILESRKESTSKDGLKTGKYKCMKSLESKIRAEYSLLHLKI